MMVLHLCRMRATPTGSFAGSGGGGPGGAGAPGPANESGAAARSVSKSIAATQPAEPHQTPHTCCSSRGGTSDSRKAPVCRQHTGGVRVLRRAVPTSARVANPRRKLPGIRAICIAFALSSTFGHCGASGWPLSVSLAERETQPDPVAAVSGTSLVSDVDASPPPVRTDTQPPDNDSTQTATWRAVVDAVHQAHKVSSKGGNGVHDINGFVDVRVDDLGIVRGIRGATVDKFLGIPYARPPLGARRWRLPQLLDSWAPTSANQVDNGFSKYDFSQTGGPPLNGTTFGPACLSAIPGGSWIHVEAEDENCLFLSVWTPRGHIERLRRGAADLLPVVFWIHGGGFIVGSPSNPSTSPPPDKFVAGANVIYVAAAYRMGAFGFVSSPAMRNYGGMFGIHDQVAALKWVRAHIHNFGGNAQDVTLMGESAGAISICLHLVLPASRGLYRRAVMQSSLCSFPFEGVSTALSTTRRLARAVGCAVEPNDERVAAMMSQKRFRTMLAQQPRHHPLNLVIPSGAQDPFLLDGASEPLEDATTNVTLDDSAPELRQPEVFEFSVRSVVLELAQQVYHVLAHLGAAAYRAVCWATGSCRAAAGDNEEGTVQSFWSMFQGRFEKQQAVIRRPGEAYRVPSLSSAQLAASILEVECMRSRSSKQLQAALPVRRGFMFYSGESFFPVINGIEVSDHPLRLIERGLWWRETDLILGHNKDEASVFVLFAYPLFVSDSLIHSFMVDTFGSETADILWRRYVVNEPPSIPLRTKVVRMMNDMWACASHFFAAHVTKYGGSLRYFQFQHEPSYLSPFLKWLGAFHGAELDFLFGVHQSGDKAPTLEETHLGAEMMRLWAEFVTSRRKSLLQDNRDPLAWIIADADSMPQGSGLESFHIAEWTKYSNETQVCLSLQTSPLAIVPQCRPQVCGLWEDTFRYGIMRVPPQTPEPFVSYMANVWGPLVLGIVAKNLAAALGSTIALVVSAVILGWRIERRRRHARASSHIQDPGSSKQLSHVPVDRGTHGAVNSEGIDNLHDHDVGSIQVDETPTTVSPFNLEGREQAMFDPKMRAA